MTVDRSSVRYSVAGHIYIYIQAERTPMAVGGTTVGPLEPEVRDLLADYRDREGHANYNEALRSLLEKKETHR